jgi:hypothetical protein
MMDPNAVFRQCFNWFIAKYGRTSAKNRETNWTTMAADWHPSMGFEVLTSRLFRGVTFASLSGHPILTRTLSTSVSVSSTAQDYLAKNTRRGSFEATTPATQSILPRSRVSGRTQSKLRRLPPSRQARTDTAWD